MRIASDSLPYGLKEIVILNRVDVVFNSYSNVSINELRVWEGETNFIEAFTDALKYLPGRLVASRLRFARVLTSSTCAILI